jgi:hypothetical protein
MDCLQDVNDLLRVAPIQVVHEKDYPVNGGAEFLKSRHVFTWRLLNFLLQCLSISEDTAELFKVAARETH